METACSEPRACRVPEPCEPLCPPPNLQVGEPEENEVKNKVQEALAGLKEKAINKMKERQGATEE